MTQFQGPTAFYNLAALLLTEVDRALQLTDAGSCDRVCVVPGEVAWDECECCQLSVNLRRVFVSDDFPTGTLGRGLVRTTPCDSPWLVGELGVTILRCAPQPTGNDLAPTCFALDAAARTLTIDAYTAQTTVISVLCDLRGEEDIVDYVMSDQDVVGPQGMCVGSDLTVFVSINR